MQGNLWIVDLYLSTLGANANGVVPIPVSASLIGASLIGVNASDATLDCGSVADADGIIDGADAGDSSVGNFLDTSDFNGVLATANQPYPFAKEGELAWSVDFDGASGTAIQKAHLQFVFAL